MSANKGKNTKPEIMLRQGLWAAGLKGYRLHLKTLPGKPDIVFSRRKLAIFVHGCFWHRCPKCDYKLPKTNPDYWKRKFDRNIIRDKKSLYELEGLGWKVITIWECDVKTALPHTVNLIKKALK
jgi:DNA mismatch endonuclease (patch repair protein)